MVTKLDLYLSTIDNINVGVLLTDLEGIIHLFNPHAEKLFGYTLNEVIGKPFFDLLIPENMRKIVQLGYKFFIDGMNKSTPATHVKGLRKNGDYFDAEASYSKLTINNVTYALGTFQDVTERKKAEEALHESEQRFKSMFNSTIDGIILADIESKEFYTCNNTFCQMLGYNLDEIKTMGVTDVHLKEDLPYIMGQFEKQSKGEFSLAKALPVKRKDGSIFYADVNSSVMTIDGKTYQMGIFRDVTERKKTEEEQEQFRHILNHDMRNIIGVISHSSYLINILFSKLNNNSGCIPFEQYVKIKKYFEIISDNDERLRTIVEDLSNYSRDKNDRYSFFKHNMYIILDSVINSLSAQLDNAHITVINNLNGLEVVCDESKIMRLWMNYLTNAIKYIDEDKFDHTVEIGFIEEDTNYRFYVKDNGIGISTEDILKLNKPYTRLYSKRADGTSIEGTGLGLASIEEIVNKHGGTTKIESEGIKKGTNFHFSLPKNINAKLRS